MQNDINVNASTQCAVYVSILQCVTFSEHCFAAFENSFLTSFQFRFICAEFFQFQGPGNVLCGLTVEHCIVCSNNGLVFNILMSRNLAFFNIKFAIFSRNCVFLIFVHSQVPENQFHGLTKNYCMVVGIIGFVINNLAFRILEIF